jgi:hypothetical protein
MVDEFVRLLKSYPVGENDRISHSNASLQCLALVLCQKLKVTLVHYAPTGLLEQMP